MSLDDVHFWPLTKVGEPIRAGDVSRVEVTQTMLACIEALDGRLKSYTTVTVDLALSQARQAETEIRQGRSASST